MRDPDLSGDGTRGWKIASTPAIREAHRREWKQNDAGVATWVVNGPFHPFWQWWFIGTISLRDQEGTEPAHLQFPGASHEIMCYSLDPSGGGTPDIDKIEAGDLRARPRFLSPPDWVVQFIVADDVQAEKLARLVATHIVVGGMSPDSDFRAYWEKLVANTAEHVRLGGHPGG